MFDHWDNNCWLKDYILTIYPFLAEENFKSNLNKTEQKKDIQIFPDFLKVKGKNKTKQPSKHFLFSKTSSRRLEDVFSVTLFVFQDVFKTSSRRVCKTSCNYVFKASSRRLGRQKNVTLKTSSRRLQDVFSTSSPRRMFSGNLTNLKYLVSIKHYITNTNCVKNYSYLEFFWSLFLSIWTE